MGRGKLYNCKHLDLSAYFDNVRRTTLMKKVAERVNDDDVMRLLKLILKVGGAKGVPQGGVVISPLLSNIYLNEVDTVLGGWANYFRVGNSSKCFGYVKD